MEDLEYCYECRLYGDDEYYNKETEEWESFCNTCMLNPYRQGEEDDWYFN